MFVRILLKASATISCCVPNKNLSAIPDAALSYNRIRSFVARCVFPRGPEWVQVRNGFAKGLWIEVDLATERNWCQGTHEAANQHALQQLVRENTVMYDIGAHIGIHAMPCARAGARVIAFEADPENAERLIRHADRNSLQDRLRVVPAAVWSTGRSGIDFRRGEPRSRGGVCWQNQRPVLASGEMLHVRAWSLDDFVADGEPVPDIIKIDVEGAESEVLKGASHILQNHHPALLVEVHTASEYEAVQGILNRASYTMTWEIPKEEFPRQCFAVAMKA